MPYCMYLRKSRKGAEAKTRGEQEIPALYRHFLTPFAVNM